MLLIGARALHATLRNLRFRASRRSECKVFRFVVSPGDGEYRKIDRPRHLSPSGLTAWGPATNRLRHVYIAASQAHRHAACRRRGETCRVAGRCDHLDRVRICGGPGRVRLCRNTQTARGTGIPRRSIGVIDSVGQVVGWTKRFQPAKRAYLDPRCWSLCIWREYAARVRACRPSRAHSQRISCGGPDCRRSNSHSSLCGCNCGAVNELSSGERERNDALSPKITPSIA